MTNSLAVIDFWKRITEWVMPEMNNTFIRNSVVGIIGIIGIVGIDNKDCKIDKALGW